MTTVEVTPASVQAAELFTVAQHLTANPHLHPVWIARRDLQLTHNTADAVNLVAWADSLTDPGVEFSDLKGVAYVYLTGEIDGIRITVWSTVSGLLAWLGSERDVYRQHMELKSLREFAATAGSGGHSG